MLLLEDDAEWEWRSRLQIDFVRSRFSREAMTASLLEALRIGRRGKASCGRAPPAASGRNAAVGTISRMPFLERVGKL